MKESKQSMALYNFSSSIGSPTRLGSFFDNKSNAYEKISHYCKVHQAMVWHQLHEIISSMPAIFWYGMVDISIY
jgi:hypothetical protein